VIIMAGGLGTRLRELTQHTPKPMLQVGDRPLLETIVSRFVEQGFSEIWLAVNYHAEQIERHFGDGSRFGATVRYLRETKRLGTAGAISLLPELPDQPLLVTNADLLVTVDYGQLLDAHTLSGATATMAVREYEYQIPYGVVRTDGDAIVGLDEKPVHQTLVNAGIYVLDREAAAAIPVETYFDMPELFSLLMARGKAVRCHNINGYWLDIGRHEDLERACVEFELNAKS
jgi:NDP-sugar pyrophosphorylase family protein